MGDACCQVAQAHNDRGELWQKPLVWQIELSFSFNILRFSVNVLVSSGFASRKRCAGPVVPQFYALVSLTRCLPTRYQRGGFPAAILRACFLFLVNLKDQFDPDGYLKFL